MYINLICMIIFLVVGGLIFLITVMVYACDDGSCGCGGCVKERSNIVSLLVSCVHLRVVRYRQERQKIH